uniref:Uncharacterized protein n=1 Tax=Candidatus Kentrum eta TaxID=2126337 RepID=A0A450VXV7_9GAMM|nr:MAG: hypothetical protein BECKH772C_GA0070978_106261 [Candidatus Kentron sp. H]
MGPGFIFLDSLTKGMHQSQKEGVMAFRCFIDFRVDLPGNVVAISHHCRVMVCTILFQSLIARILNKMTKSGKADD